VVDEVEEAVDTAFITDVITIATAPTLEVDGATMTDAAVLTVQLFRSEVVGASEDAIGIAGGDSTPSNGSVYDTVVSTVADALMPEIDGSASLVGSIPDTWSRPIAAEVLAVRYVGAPVVASSRNPVGVQEVLGQGDSFTDEVVSTIRSLAVTGLNLLFKMWSVLVLAFLGAAMIEVSRGRRPLELWESSRS
jgi:hypothetical protein